MKIEEKTLRPDAEDSANQAARTLLESENINLRRMIVDLIEQNQRLREQVQRMEVHRDVGPRDNPAAIRVDSQAA